MDFDNLGAICHHCKRQDYLPIRCSLCNKMFCKDHSSFDNHNCKKFKDTNKIKNKKTRSSIYIESCNLPNCKKKELIKFECRDCGLNFCINHRFYNDHNCNKNKVINNNKIAKKEINKNKCCLIS